MHFQLLCCYVSFREGKALQQINCNFPGDGGNYLGATCTRIHSHRTHHASLWRIFRRRIWGVKAMKKYEKIVEMTWRWMEKHSYNKQTPKNNNHQPKKNNNSVFFNGVLLFLDLVDFFGNSGRLTWWCLEHWPVILGVEMKGKFYEIWTMALLKSTHPRKILTWWHWDISRTSK